MASVSASVLSLALALASAVGENWRPRERESCRQCSETCVHVQTPGWPPVVCVCVCVCGGSCTFQRSGTTLSFLEVRVVKHLLGGRALPAVAGQAAADQALGLCRDLRLGRENQLGVQDGLRRVGS